MVRTLFFGTFLYRGAYFLIGVLYYVIFLISILLCKGLITIYICKYAPPSFPPTCSCAISWKCIFHYFPPTPTCLLILHVIFATLQDRKVIIYIFKQEKHHLIPCIIRNVFLNTTNMSKMEEIRHVCTPLFWQISEPCD